MLYAEALKWLQMSSCQAGDSRLSVLIIAWSRIITSLYSVGCRLWEGGIMMEEICDTGVRFNETKSRKYRDKWRWSAGAVVLKLIRVTAWLKNCCCMFPSQLRYLEFLKIDTYVKFNIFLRGASLQVSRVTHYLLEKQFKMYIFCQTTALLLFLNNLC